MDVRRKHLDSLNVVGTKNREKKKKTAVSMFNW